jgi:hypothetical protein
MLAVIVLEASRLKESWKGEGAETTGVMVGPLLYHKLSWGKLALLPRADR